MINIYSIKEIIDASNNIFNRSKNKKDLKTYKKINDSDDIKNQEPLVLSDKIELKEEVVLDNKEIKSPKKEKNFKISNKYDYLIDELYAKFNKKIKRNTLKLIFDLKIQISQLIKEKDLIENSKKIIQEQKNKLVKDIKEQRKLLNNEIQNQKEKLGKDLENQKKQLNKEVEILKLENKKLVKEKETLELKVTDLSINLKKAVHEINVQKKKEIELKKQIETLKIEDENKEQKIYDISKTESKNEFFQEENLRIGSELLEIKKKYEILKSEIEKYEKQKSDLISKINSVNDALNDTNVLTNVFENKVENKVKVIDHNDLKKKNSDLDELIKNIFSTKI